MGVGQISVAAATAVVGYDLLVGEWFQQMPDDRVLTGIGLAGSAAALDTLVELFVDTVKVGEFYNSAAGAVLMDAHMIDLADIYVPGGSRIFVYVIDAPTTSPINLVLEWEEI